MNPLSLLLFVSLIPAVLQGSGQGAGNVHHYPLDGLDPASIDSKQNDDSGAGSFRAGPGHAARHKGAGKAPFGNQQAELRGLTPFESILYDRLIQLGGVESVHFVEQSLRRYNNAGSTSSTSKHLEITGGNADTHLYVADLLDRARLLARKSFTVESLVIIQQKKEGEKVTSARDPRIERVRGADFDARAEALRARNRSSVSAAAAKTDPLAITLRVPSMANASTVVNGQPTLHSIIKQRSFITDYDLTKSGDSTIADPVIDVISEGVVLYAAPVMPPDRDSMSVYLSARISNIIGVDRNVVTTLAGVESKLKIDLPETVDSTWNSGRIDDIRPGEAIRLTGLKSVDAETGFHELELWWKISETGGGEHPDYKTTFARVVACDARTATVVVRTVDSVKIPSPSPDGKYEIIDRDGRVVSVVSGTIQEKTPSILTIVEGGIPLSGDAVRKR